MKKLLLTSLLGLFGFVGAFVSAGSINFTYDSDYNYVPDSITLSSDTTISSSNFSNIVCEDDYGCSFEIKNSDEDLLCQARYYANSSEFVVDDGSPDLLETCSLSAGTYSITNNPDYSLFNITLSDSSLVVNGGDNSGGDNSGSLLPGGESDLSGIISGLSDTINEFIPYLVYLGLGIITALIGFVAIRWLINRTSSKVRGTFSSGRRRR